MSRLNHTPTHQENLLAEALRDRKIEVIQQYSDGYKTIDLYLPKAKLDIEVDGMDHFMIVKQVHSDLQREYWSERAGYHTIHIPNFIIEKKEYLNKVVDTLVEVVNLLAEESLKTKLIQLSKLSDKTVRRKFQ